MRRVTLLALLALVVPSAALANSFNFKNVKQGGSLCIEIVGNTTCSTGDFVSGSISSLLVAPVNVEVIGSMNTIDIQLRDLICSSVTTCTFTNLGADVTHNGIVLFNVGGLVSSAKLIRTTTTATISADFGSLDITVFFDGSFSGNTLTSGNAFITFPPIPPNVPEPSTLELLELGLLGTGVIGVAEMARRKLKPLT